jgi:hypothetical protein
MSDSKPESSSREADFQDILERASEETTHRAQVRAANASAVPAVSRKRAVAGALAVAVPVLAIVLTVNLFGVSLVEMMTPAPSPAAGLRQAQDALDGMVKDIEGFREDYEELPERLAEVASPFPGQWTYSTTPGGHYLVVLKMHGQVVTFDSAKSNQGTR